MRGPEQIGGRRRPKFPSPAKRSHAMKYRLALSGAVSLAAAVLMLWAFPAPPAGGTAAGATYSNGTLHVTIPKTAAGKLTVDVLGPEDQVVGRTEQHVDGTAPWQA